MKKKGQASGAGAASLVLVILLILVFYILFLPPQEREELLEKEYENGEEVEEEGLGHVLLSEAVGRLEFISRTEYEHNIQPFYLYAVTEATVLKKINPFYVKNGVGDKQNNIVNLKLTNLENTDNILLSFSTTKHKGRLIIKLNDIIIFENEFTTVNVDPIELPKEFLQEDNILECDVSSVGWAFWKTNEYNLQNVKITGDITDVSTQESRNIFQISGTEKNNLKEVYLRFLADCIPGQIGRLDVLLNGRDIFSGVPDCGSLSRKIYIDYVYLNSGTNSIVFKTTKGSYLINQIFIKTKLEETRTATYYFKVNSTDYENIQDNKVVPKLKIYFVEEEEDRDAKIIIAGKDSKCTKDLDQIQDDFDDFYYWLEIKECIDKGQNYVNINPETVLNIVELRVELEDVN